MSTTVRRLLLGSGPLKRATDRVHALSRVVLLAVVLVAVPTGVAVGLAVSSALHAAAGERAAQRHSEQATLLAYAPAATDPTAGDVRVAAAWAGPDGRAHEGRVLAPAGTPAGAVVGVWVDEWGNLATEPMTGDVLTAESLEAGLIAALTLPALAGCAHLGVVRLVDRARDRRWTAEWAATEPLWTQRR